MKEKVFETREEALEKLRKGEVNWKIETQMETIYVVDETKLLVLTDVSDDCMIEFDRPIELVLFLVELYRNDPRYFLSIGGE